MRRSTNCGLSLISARHAGDEVIFTDITLAAERIYSVDTGNLSGSYEEQQILMQEIRGELAPADCAKDRSLAG